MKKILCLFLFSCLISLVKADDLKIMSYNIRYDNPGDGVNAWQFRKDRVADLIRMKQPDIVGVQEALASQISDLEERMKGYAWVGVGRDDGKNAGEHCAVFYKIEKLEMLETGTFWLSETQEVPGSKGWDAAVTRITTWVKFKSKSDETTFYVFNTHFDHKGEEAQLNSAKLVRNRIDEMCTDVPVILMGDLNFRPYSSPHEVMLSDNFKVKLNDTYTHAERSGDQEYTNLGFDGNNKRPSRIDYIFTSKHWDIKYFDIVDLKFGASFPSDHLPVYVELK